MLIKSWFALYYKSNLFQEPSKIELRVRKLVQNIRRYSLDTVYSYALSAYAFEDLCAYRAIGNAIRYSPTRLKYCIDVRYITLNILEVRQATRYQSSPSPRAHSEFEPGEFCFRASWQVAVGDAEVGYPGPETARLSLFGDG